MMRPDVPLLGGLLFGGLVLLTAGAAADPTWPASTDELEEIMYQLSGFQARSFAETISPCDNEASGPGRQTAAEFLRVGFHDMSTANAYFGTGGLDGSLQFELRNSENTGPGHATTLEFMGRFLSARSSIADLIAAGVYASVRSCGGPLVPVRGGRIDATEAGDPGVPQPQNAIGILTDQFDRMGFTVPEMIQAVACGHTLGAVHGADFPDLVPGSADGEETFDSTSTKFDNALVEEYLVGNTTDLLVVGPSVGHSKNSDFRVFNADGNATVEALADPAVYRDTCRVILQKIIDVVPKGVNLTDPITPYAVKPVDLQLTLINDTTLVLGGYIRVRTTGSSSHSISNIVLKYKDRTGGTSSCGGCSASISTFEVGSGFDDTFAFFPISLDVDIVSGISSFTVEVSFENGTVRTLDNNGATYPISDEVLIQRPQSCLNRSSGDLVVSTLVRNGRKSLPVNLTVYYLVPRNKSDENPVPALLNRTILMTEGDCVGDYTFYSASFSIPGGLSSRATLDVVSGREHDIVSDAFKSADKLPRACAQFAGVVGCSKNTTTALRAGSISRRTPSEQSGMRFPNESSLGLWHREQAPAVKIAPARLRP